MESDEDVPYFCDDDVDVSSDHSPPEDEDTPCISDDDVYASSDQKPDKNFRILNPKQIEKLQDEDVNTVASILSVSRTLACSLLMQHKWCVETTIESCGSDLSDHREPVRINGNNACKICFKESNPNLEFLSLACSHLFCVECWERYISLSIGDGPRCLTLTCPEPKCKATVGLDVIDDLTSQEDRDKYYTYLRRSYIECCRKRKWCPSPGCELAVELDPGLSFEVTCDCSYKFCFNCSEESHRPLDCETVRRWVEKDTSDSGNSKWILAYTKPCPKCHRSIEKNQGCNHMTCRTPCSHEFCWLCLGSWIGHMSCNGYDKDNPTQTARENARVEIERYMHYYERCDSNRKARIKAMSDLDHARKKQLAKLSDLQRVPQTELDFVIKAWEQIVECRHVLRWSYAKAYYLCLNKDENLKFFEFLQGQAESVLEKLHHCVEKEMDGLMVEYDFLKFRDFKSNVIGLTRTTGNHFLEFVRALEEDNFCSARPVKVSGEDALSTSRMTPQPKKRKFSGETSDA